MRLLENALLGRPRLQQVKRGACPVGRFFLATGGNLAPRQAVPGMASWFRGSHLRANFPPAARSFGPAHNSPRARKRAVRSNKCAEHETRAERPLAAGAAQIGHAGHRLPRRRDAVPLRTLTPPSKPRASGSRRALCGADGELSCGPRLMLAALVRAERVFRAQRVAPRAARLRTAGGSPARPARDATPGRRGPLARGFAAIFARGTVRPRRAPPVAARDLSRGKRAYRPTNFGLRFSMNACRPST